MSKLNLRLFRLINQSKGSFVAIIAVIAVGLAVYAALSMAAINLVSTLDYYYEETNFADINVQLVKIPRAEIEDLYKIEGIEAVEGRIVYDVPLNVKDGDEKVTVRVISISENNAINEPYIVEGAAIQSSGNDALVLQQFANARNIEIGDVIKPQMGGRVYSLEAKAIVGSPEYVYLMENAQSFVPQPEKFGVVFVSEQLAAQSFGLNNSYNELVISVQDDQDLDAIKEQLEKRLDKFGVKRIILQDEQLSNRMISEEINGLQDSSNAVPVVFLGVAAVIIAIMLSRMVKNDRMTIGVLKALGYGNKRILLHYTQFAILIGVIGAVLGVLMGTILSGYMTKMYIQFFNIPTLQINFYMRYLVYSVLISAFFCIGAGLWGARKILTFAPSESMRPEAPTVGKRVFLDRIAFLWERLTFSWKVVLRNILRSKKRFLFITIGIAMTYMMTLMPLSLDKTVDTMFLDHYTEFMRMDYNINFNRPLNVKAAKELKHFVKTEHIEPKVEYPFELSWGHKSKVATIIGLPIDTQFYKFEVENNPAVRLPEKGILLSEGLARSLGVGRGDTIQLSTFLPNKDDVYVEVKDVIKQSLGVNAYMNIEAMWGPIVDKEMITGVYLDSTDDVKTKLEDFKSISSIQSTNDMRDAFVQFMELMIYSIGVMLFFAGILGFTVVYTTTVMGINERRLEFSSLRVMGFYKSEIYHILTKENVIMTVFGILLGIPLGNSTFAYLERTYSTDIYTFSMEVGVMSYVYAALVTAVFVAIAQLATLRKIKKLDFIDALKSRIT